MSKNSQGIKERFFLSLGETTYVLGMLRINDFKIFRGSKAFISKHTAFHMHYNLHWLGLGCCTFPCIIVFFG